MSVQRAPATLPSAAHARPTSPTRFGPNRSARPPAGSTSTTATTVHTVTSQLPVLAPIPRSAVIWPSDADTLKRFMTMTMPAAMASTPINAEPPRAPLRAAPLSETPTSPPTLLLRPACRPLPAPGPCAARPPDRFGPYPPARPENKKARSAMLLACAYLGSPGRIRTYNPPVNSRMLCR